MQRIGSMASGGTRNGASKTCWNCGQVQSTYMANDYYGGGGGSKEGGAKGYYGTSDWCVNDSSFPTKEIEISGSTATSTEPFVIISFVSLNLTINPSGGIWEGNTQNSTKTIIQGTSETIANPTKTGYNFVRWDVEGAGSSISGNTFTMGSEDAKITAVWEAADVEYKVKQQRQIQIQQDPEKNIQDLTHQKKNQQQ